MLTDRCVIIGCLSTDSHHTYPSMIMRYASPTTRGFLSPLLFLSSCLFAAKENLWDQGIIHFVELPKELNYKYRSKNPLIINFPLCQHSVYAVMINLSPSTIKPLLYPNNLKYLVQNWPNSSSGHCIGHFEIRKCNFKIHFVPHLKLFTRLYFNCLFVCTIARIVQKISGLKPNLYTVGQQNSLLRS